MKRIISVSRRTDVPAFYGDWFMRRLTEGRAGYINPFDGRRRLVSLRPEDVAVFVFWSKNFIPFTEQARRIAAAGYHVYFNYTINNYPRLYEPAAPSASSLIENLKVLSAQHSPEQINWRYDPIVISKATSADFHMRNFKTLAASLAGFVRRCTISFVALYGKVRRSFGRLRHAGTLDVEEPPVEEKVRLAEALAECAEAYGMKLYSCCCPYLEGGHIGRAHCIDGGLFQELFFKDDPHTVFKPGPTRTGCGCAESRDIGVYDTCAHGCVYCYANANRETARMKYERHDVDSAFLGVPAVLAREWIAEVEREEGEGKKHG